MLVQSLLQPAKFCFSFAYSFYSTFIILPLFILYQVLSYFANLFNQVNQFFSYEGLPVRVILRIWNQLRKLGKRILGIEEIRRHSRLLRQSRSQEQVTQTFSRASANPHQITQNEKVMILMQKMKRLQQILYQQSIDRRKAQGQLFDLRQKFQQKSSALIKQKSQCVQNINKINVLKLELAQKTDNLQKSTGYVAQLEKQVKQMKQKIEGMMRPQEKAGESDEKVQIEIEKKSEQSQKDAEQKVGQEQVQQTQASANNDPQVEVKLVTQNQNLKMYAQKKKKKKVLKN